jgi:hypothetical protein
LVGTAIADGALLAVWSREGKNFGCTIEARADQIPLYRELSVADLAPDHLLGQRLSLMEARFRKVFSSRLRF